MKQTLWYRAPAKKWIEALPVGNGRLGAMLYGGKKEEILELNEDSLWSGRPGSHDEAGRAVYFRRAGDLARQGRYMEAQDCIESNFSGEYIESYVPLGTLRLAFQGMDGEAEDYRRSLNLTSAVHQVSFRQGDTVFRREAFVSYPDQALVMRLWKEGSGWLSFSVTLDSPLVHSVMCREGRLHLEGLCPTHVEPDYVDSEDPVVYDPAAPGIRFHGVAAIQTDGGLRQTENSLVVQDAEEAVLVFTARSNFAGRRALPEEAGVPYREQALTDAKRALERPYKDLRERHTTDFGRLFGGVSLSGA